MLDLSKEIKTDANKEENGAWVKFIREARLLIASATSRRYRDARRRAFDKYRNELRSDDDVLVEEGRRKLALDVASETLLGWEGILDENEEVEYSPANARMLLEKYPILLAFVEDQQTEIGPYRPAIDRDAVKN